MGIFWEDYYGDLPVVLFHVNASRRPIVVTSIDQLPPRNLGT